MYEKCDYLIMLVYLLSLSSKWHISGFFSMAFSRAFVVL